MGLWGHRRRLTRHSFFRAWTTGDSATEQKIFVDGKGVCVIYDLITNTSADTAPIAEWYHLRDGKISAARGFFDARPFVAMFEHRAGQ